MPDEASLSPTDSELLRRSAGGDRGAFERLVDRHEAAILRYLRGFATAQEAVEDAFQETFLAAWRAAASFRGEGSARGWLLVIARNALHRQYRRHGEEPASHLSLEELGAQAGWGLAEDDDFARRLENRELVERGFRALAPEEREILILRDLEGLSGEEAAALLGLSLAAMKSRLHRARLRFTAQLRGGSHHDP